MVVQFFHSHRSGGGGGGGGGGDGVRTVQVKKRLSESPSASVTVHEALRLPTVALLLTVPDTTPCWVYSTPDGCPDNV